MTQATYLNLTKIKNEQLKDQLKEYFDAIISINTANRLLLSDSHSHIVPIDIEAITYERKKSKDNFEIQSILGTNYRINLIDNDIIFIYKDVVVESKRKNITALLDEFCIKYKFEQVKLRNYLELKYSFSIKGISIENFHKIINTFAIK